MPEGYFFTIITVGFFLATSYQLYRLISNSGYGYRMPKLWPQMPGGMVLTEDQLKKLQMNYKTQKSRENKNDGDSEVLLSGPEEPENTVPGCETGSLSGESFGSNDRSE